LQNFTGYFFNYLGNEGERTVASCVIVKVTERVAIKLTNTTQYRWL